MNLRPIVQHKKGAIAELMPIITGLVAFAITIVVAFLIMAKVATNTQVAADANATQAVKDVQNATKDIPNWLPIIIITIIGVLLIGLVSMFGRMRR